MHYIRIWTVDEGWILWGWAASWGWTVTLGTVISPWKMTALLVLHTSEITSPLQSTWTQSPSQVAVAASLISSWIELIMSQDSIHLSLHSHCLPQPWPLSKLLLFSVWAEAATHKPHKMRVSYLHHIILQKSSVLTPSLHHLNHQYYCTIQEHEMLMHRSGFDLSVPFSFIPVPHLFLADSVHPRQDSAAQTLPMQEHCWVFSLFFSPPKSVFILIAN